MKAELAIGQAFDLCLAASDSQKITLGHFDPGSHADFR